MNSDDDLSNGGIRADGGVLRSLPDHAGESEEARDPDESDGTWGQAFRDSGR